MNFSHLLAIIVTMPFTVFIVLPLAVYGCWLTYGALKQLILQPLFDWPTTEALSDRSPVQEEKRAENRQKTSGLRARIADQSGVYDGIVANISKAGICLKNLPERFSSSTEKLSVCIKGKTEEYCCFFTPSWETEDRTQGKIIGGKLDNTRQNWLKLVHSVQ